MLSHHPHPAQTPRQDDALIDLLSDDPEDQQNRPPQQPAAVAAPLTDSAMDEPEPIPTVPATPAAEPSQQRPALDPNTAALYEPVNDEDFNRRRLRYDRQETMLFGPAMRPSRPSRSSPYDLPPRDPDDAGPNPSDRAEDNETVNHAFAVQDVQPDALPLGWTVDSHGYFQLDLTKPKDYWEVRAGCLIRHHLLPRRQPFKIDDAKDIPFTEDQLDPNRVTLMQYANGKMQLHTDNGYQNYKNQDGAWTGMTIFQINGATRKEFGLYANVPAKKVARQQKHMVQKAKKTSDLSERGLTLHERELFMQAKVKELKSFFEHGVWEFQTTKEADPSRTLTARMILKWSRNPDGSPRAKARLIVRGYADKDALEGKVATAAPTTSRLARSFFLSISSLLKWEGWTADVATAFLQGTAQERELWVQLPQECLTILGCDSSTRMRLIKPCYGQLDAPRKWFQEATRRLRALGFRVHHLDPCCFLLYESDFPNDANDVSKTDQVLGEDRLCCMICIHVDDMLGGGNPESATYKRVRDELQQAFSFREWQTSNKLEYCGATLERDGTNWKLHHTDYLAKVKPLTLEKNRGPDDYMTPSELTRFRGLLGSLQWPAVQSQPHISCATSLLAGQMSAGLVKSITDGNKLLQFAKQNSDISLNYSQIGQPHHLRLVGMFDAAFAIRKDGASQGGFLLMLVPQSTFDGVESEYHVIDWKSLKLPRVARSSLGAEAQSAGQCCDAIDFCCQFWGHLLQPRLPLRELLQQPSPLKPVMVTDAKALYDSYHREGVVGGSLTDKRTGLEVRVLKERLEALDGSFKWISSERQFADGLTKDTPGVRQLLADRLRYAKIKFTWDPMYLAAKKKTAEDRQLSRNEFARTKNQVKDDDETYDPKLPAVQEDDMDTKEEPNETAEAYVSGHFTYVDLSQMTDEDENDGYLHVPKTEDMIKDTVKEPCTVLYDLDTKAIVKYDMTKILDTFKGLTVMMMMLYWMLTLPGAKAAHRSEDLQLNEDSNLLEYFWYGDFSKMIYAKYDPYLWLTLMLAGVLVSFIVGHVYGWAAGSARVIFLRHVRGDRLQRELDQLQQQHQQLTEERDTLTGLLREERQRHQREKQRLTNRIGQLNQNLATQEDNFWYKSEQVTNLQNEQNKLKDDLAECRGVLHVCRDALRRANSELSRHWHLHHENQDIYVGAGSHVYHEHEDCGSLADFDGNYATMHPCALCATFEVTPFIEVPNPGGETLEQDLLSAIDYCDEALAPTDHQ